MRGVSRVLAALAVVIVLALALQRWWLAPVVAQRLSASSGRAVHLDAMWLSVSTSFEPVVQLRGIRIANAPWADSSRPFAALASATAVLSWRSVVERRPVIALMVLRDGEVDLERRSDGLRNWRLSHPDDRGPGRFKVLAIRGERATLRVLHDPLALDIEVRATLRSAGDSDAAERDAMPTSIDARGTWRGVSFVIAAATADALTLLETGRAVRMRGHVAAGAARLDVDGSIGDIVRWPRVDARIGFTAPSPGRLAALLGVPLAETAKAVRLEGALRGDREGYALAALRGRWGATDLAGEVRWTRGGERDLLHAELTSDAADLADLRSLAGHRRVTTPSATVVASAANPAVSAPVGAASATARTSAARPLDVELRLAARRLRGAGLPPLHGAALEATLAHGRVQVSRFEVGLGQGRIAGKANLELGAAPMQGDAEVDVHALPIESLLGEHAAKGRISGALSGRAVLKAGGDSLEALLASAAGTVSAFITGGTISSLLDAKMGLQGGRIVRSLLTGAEPIALRCAAVVIDVRKGEGRIRTLVIETEHTKTTGSGTIDVAHQTLDLVLTPEAKQPGLFVLDRSIHLLGALREPRHELVARAAAAPASLRGCRPERP